MDARAIVLAAGRSTRMGAPKALTPIAGAPAVARIVRALHDAGVADVTVVPPVGVELPPLEARVVVNPDPDAGRTGSLQLGLAAQALAPTLVVWPVDHPLATAATVRALLAAEGEWVLPTHLGRTGHPILVRGRAIDAIRRAAPAMPLRSIPPTLGIVPTRVAVEDAGVLANLDTPGDVASSVAGTVVDDDQIRFFFFRQHAGFVDVRRNVELGIFPEYTARKPAAASGR